MLLIGTLSQIQHRRRSLSQTTQDNPLYNQAFQETRKSLTVRLEHVLDHSRRETT
jgi:hypothetical protein